MLLKRDDEYHVFYEPAVQHRAGPKNRARDLSLIEKGLPEEHLK